MKTTRTLNAFSAFALMLLGGMSLTHAQQQQPENVMELRLREALRTTTMQLRTADSERIAAQIKSDELQKERDSLTKQVSALTRKGEQDRAAAQKQITDLKSVIASLQQNNENLTADLAKWRDAANKASALAQRTESERSAFEVRVAELERTVADREARNVELVRIGNEILDRLEKFGLGDAIAAREPFIGSKRVQIQNLVQDYSDRVMDQKYEAGLVQDNVSRAGSEQ